MKMEEFNIDRNKPPQEIKNQTDRLEEKFQELEQKGPQCQGAKSFMSVGIRPRIRRKVKISRKWKLRQLRIAHKRKEEKAGPLEAKMDLVGKYSYANMRRRSSSGGG